MLSNIPGGKQVTFKVCIFYELQIKFWSLLTKKYICTSTWITGNSMKFDFNMFQFKIILFYLFILYIIQARKIYHKFISKNLKFFYTFNYLNLKF